MSFDLQIHQPPRERAAHCATHGPYTSKCYLRNIWLGCSACIQQKQAAEMAEQVRQQERMCLQEWRSKLERAAIPPRFQDRSLDNFTATTPAQQAALQFATEYAKNFVQVRSTGRCALFLGKPGTGKTHLATAIGLHAMHKHHAKVVFTTVLRAVRMVKDSWGRGARISESQAIATMVAPDLLILDEVGVQFGSEFEKHILFDVLNERYELRRPTLLLSNLTLAEVRAFVGERVMDRISEDGGAVVPFTWDSYRRPAA
ncbi:AAA family ATPase [Lampropedia aestuarii]|uniref:AAA family ATPase n=1 Tax=Lampropedia aestuarii TaxID=2562762 RepID=A0A4S5BNU3_9BURK|nr:ATP-binding protein [Lampropedia aestuarii]MDH5858994.1 ATP-binding protein [Lampropedia aestuarii]THJ32793.1 AAA family ATPase [Lampropedia aestuarii]